MANLAASTIKRPGTIVTTSGVFSVPAQIASHAVAYMFVTVPFGQGIQDQNGNWVETYETQGYSELVPNVPTQVSSVDDYLTKIGGSVPDPVKFPGAWISYQSVKLFFRNAGNQGVLYVIRVPFTPEVKVSFNDPNTALQDGSQVRYVSLRIGDKYVGQTLTNIAIDTGLNDSDGIRIWGIKTSATDASDVAYDVYRAIESDPNIYANFIVKQTDTQVNAGEISIYSKSAGQYPVVNQSFIKYYGSNNTVNASGATANLYTSRRRISFRLSTNKEVTVLKFSGIPTIDDIRDAYKTSAGLPVNAPIVDRTLVAVQVYFGNTISVPDSKYYYWDNFSEAFLPLKSGMSDIIPNNSLEGTNYRPKAIQVFYTNVAGENRAIIVDGTDNNNPGEAPKVKLFSERIAEEINNILEQKGISDYYEITPSSWELDIPNAAVVNSSNFTSTDNSPIITTDPRKVPGTVSSTGFNTFDYVATVDVLSKIGSPAPISAGSTKSGTQDANVATSAAPGQPSDYLSTKNAMVSKKQDYIVSIESSIDPDRFEPGFLLCPEAFSVFKSTPSGLSKTEARLMRLDIAAALQGVATGAITTSLFGNGAGFQSLGGGTSLELVALIDCGADVTSHLEAQLELQLFKDSIGDTFGHAAYYAPHLVTIDEGNPVIPPSAGVAGIAIARYSQEGFQQPPAGTKYSLRGVQSLTFKITSQQQEISNPLGLNAIRSLPNRGICVWGSRTMSSNPLYKFVNTRVILNVLISTLGKSFDDLLFDVIDGTGGIFNRVRNIGIQVCNQLYQANALYGAQAEDAYSVICDTSNNSEIDLENGTVKLDVYVVPSPTLERIFVSVVRTPIGQIAFINDAAARNSFQ